MWVSWATSLMQEGHDVSFEKNDVNFFTIIIDEMMNFNQTGNVHLTLFSKNVSTENIYLA
jgi:hypothetical protein